MPSSVEVDRIDERQWSEICERFADANLYQTWPYEAVRSGEQNLSHLIVKHGCDVVAAVQARLVRVPYLGSGLAYIRWGPLSGNSDARFNIFRDAVRALRIEYVDRRRLCLRLVPRVVGESNESIHSILQEEGYTLQRRAKSDVTILIDLRPELDELYRGLHHKWRYHLNKARKQDLHITESEDEQSFELFERIHHEMVDRKKFFNSVDISQLKAIQRRLPTSQKMRVFLCHAGEELCAGGVCSVLGDTAVYLFGATSNRGLSSYASYLVHWNMLAWAKARGCSNYDLNGVDPVRNAGGHQFKSQLAGGYGRQVAFVGQYDVYSNLRMKAVFAAGESVRRQLTVTRRALARFG
jgi:hypothetical protein